MDATQSYTDLTVVAYQTTNGTTELEQNFHNWGAYDPRCQNNRKNQASQALALRAIKSLVSRSCTGKLKYRSSGLEKQRSSQSIYFTKRMVYITEKDVFLISDAGKIIAATCEKMKLTRTLSTSYMKISSK